MLDDEATGAEIEALLLAQPIRRHHPDMHVWGWLREGLRADPWLEQLDAIRVTGSKGKGSTCRMLDALGSALGISTGRTSSPHLLQVNERISVEGHDISNTEFARAITWALQRSNDYVAQFDPDGSPSTSGLRFCTYDVLLASALRHFANRRPELVISEAGKGGRFDPGWVFPSTLAAITSVEFEHAQLGPSVYHIAYHKADICSPGGTLVVAPLDPSLLRALGAYTRMRGVELVDVRELVRWRVESWSTTSMTLDVELAGHAIPELRLGLVGEHQANNAALALALAWLWVGRHRPEIGAETFIAAARDAFAELRFAGRFSLVHAEPEIYIDVAHTSEGARALATTIAASRDASPTMLVFGLTADRYPHAMLTPLLDVVDELVVTRPSTGPRAHEPLQLAAIAEQITKRVPVHCEENVSAALRYALERARSLGLRIVVTGGHAIAAEFAHALAGHDPDELVRFVWGASPS
ncbi:bifunctional folylpolyglutamate synthase/dihydrofolate synthase [Enhygromyxa salina]|uniref:Dihydrofolate synthase/folylpolyglutamate synthase n=1 Tax=Enhygromyxa salina TaxID=215803 RepID=A0A2S9YJ74_9BACT|nr:Mur ligase family protein [Enhygromyxa salina]PRQ05155.1 Bifunctional protein FolC [Enhygromyxa salina]